MFSYFMINIFYFQCSLQQAVIMIADQIDYQLIADLINIILVIYRTYILLIQCFSITCNKYIFLQKSLNLHYYMKPL